MDFRAFECSVVLGEPIGVAELRGFFDLLANDTDFIQFLLFC